MDFYCELNDLVQQIPRGRVAILSDLAEALGDKFATIALPQSLSIISNICYAARRVVKADGSLILSSSKSTLKKEGLKVSGLRVLKIDTKLFKDFKSKYPLKKLRESQFLCSKKVILKDGQRKPKTVGGLDVSYVENNAIAAAVLMDFKTLNVIEKAIVKVDVKFPYIPGYLAFRELPALMAANHALNTKPDILFVDGHGILHPAGCGIATHVGIKTGIPTIGVGKKLLVGTPSKKTLKIAEASPVLYRGRIHGYALRTSKSKHPIYISPGSKISVRTALKLTRVVLIHRIPEPIRQAHIFGKKRKIRKQEES